MIFEIVEPSGVVGPDRAVQNADPRFAMLTPNRRCLCRACGGFFSSAWMFDKHRYQDSPRTRACHDELWLQAHGYLLTDKGFWASGRVPDATLKALRQARLRCAP